MRNKTISLPIQQIIQKVAMRWKQISRCKDEIDVKKNTYYM